MARLSLGLFFAVSGYNKLFVAAKHEDLIALMTKIGIPFPDLMAVPRRRGFAEHDRSRVACVSEAGSG